MNYFKHIGKFILENKFRYLAGIVLLIVVDVLQLITPLLTGNFVDTLQEGGLTKGKVIFFMVAVILVTLGVALGRFGWRMTIIGVAKKLEYNVRKDVFNKLTTLNQEYYNSTKTGDIMAKCTNDIMTVRQAFGQGTILVVDSFFMAIMAISIMITQVNLSLTIIALIPLPIVVLVMNLIKKSVGKRFRLVQEAFSTISERAQESFSGIRVIKTFVQEHNNLAYFNKANKSSLDRNLDLIKVQGILEPFVSTISYISLFVSILYGGNLVINQTITLGELVSFMSLISMMTWPMMALGFMFSLVQRGKVSLKRVNDILDSEMEVDRVYSGEESKGSSISVKDLTFRYPESEVNALENISFNINQGETLAIVGHTGSGKSTLVELLLKTFLVEDNKIFIGGLDLNSITLDSLRNKIGYVPQNNFLFSRSITGNIGFNTSNIDQNRVENMSKISMVYDEIDALDKKFETELGERGVNLSGGQKQRISIARAFYKDPEIIILDDSLSAVDTKTEDNILRHIREELKNRTAILISHRVSTVKDADKIIVLSEGKIIESGTHGELISQDGYYKGLYDKQLLEQRVME